MHRSDTSTTKVSPTIRTWSLYDPSETRLPGKRLAQDGSQCHLRPLPLQSDRRRRFERQLGNVFAYTTTIGPIYPLYIRDGNGNILYNEDGIKLYDYGQNAGMERSIFTNSNALSESRLNTQSSEGNAFNGTAYFDITFLKDFKFTFNAGCHARRNSLDNYQKPLLRTVRQ